MEVLHKVLVDASYALLGERVNIVGERSYLKITKNLKLVSDFIVKRTERTLERNEIKC